MPKPKLLGGIGKINFGKQYRQGNRIYDSNEIAMCLNASPVGNLGGYSYLYAVESNNKIKKGDVMKEVKNIISAPRGYKLVNFCEFDKYAIQSYCAIHNADESLNLGDITKVDETKIEPFDMICGGSPCFVAGTKVMTDNGYKNIEDIKIGDKVLTHKNRYMPVVNIGGELNKEIYYLEAQGSLKVECTDYHPFYIKKTKTSKPEKLKLKDIKKGYYVGTFVNNKGVLENKIRWHSVTNILKTNKTENVYNIEVEEDHTYTANNIITFNCQDFSIAGNQNGSMWKCRDCGYEYNPLTVHHSNRHKCPKCNSEQIDKTRSSLLVEWLRIIRANKPKWGIYENVKNIVGKKFKDTFQMFIDELHEYGYNTYFEVLNAKDYGIPQNRERVYLIIIQKDFDNGKFKFPNKFPLKLRLKDMLEDEVLDKYYLSDEVQKRFKFTDNLFLKDVVGTTKPNFRTIGQRDLVYKQDCVIGALVATDYKQPKQILCTNSIEKAELEQVGQIYGSEKEPNPQAGRIYSNSGISPALDSCSGGNRMPKVLLDEPKINVIGNYSPSGHDASRVVDVGEIAPTVKENHGTVTAVLENNKLDKYYLSEKGVKYVLNPKRGMCTDVNADIVQTVTAKGQSNWTGSFISPDIESLEKSSTIGSDEPTLIKKIDGTEINSNDNLNNIRIRKLTPKECFRLMGFSDDDFEKAKYYSEEEVEKLNLRSLKKYKNLPPDEKIERISNSQLYKQAGNSIVVDVLYYIFKELYIAMPYLFENLRVSSYFSGIGAFEKALDKLYKHINSISKPLHQSSNLIIEEDLNNKNMDVIIYDDYNSRVRADQNTIGTITSTVGHSALRNSYKLIEVSNNQIN